MNQKSEGDQRVGKVVIEGLVINGEVTHGEVMEDLRSNLQAFSGDHVRITIERVEVGRVQSSEEAGAPSIA